MQTLHLAPAGMSCPGLTEAELGLLDLLDLNTLIHDRYLTVLLRVTRVVVLGMHNPIGCFILESGFLSFVIELRWQGSHTATARAVVSHCGSPSWVLHDLCSGA